MTKPKRIILGVTGSIAAYKSADILRRLSEKGFKVSVVMTKEAERFITPMTLSALAGEAVYREMFEQDDDSWQMPHIRLAEEAGAAGVNVAHSGTVIGVLMDSRTTDGNAVVAHLTRGIHGFRLLFRTTIVGGGSRLISTS